MPEPAAGAPPTPPATVIINGVDSTPIAAITSVSQSFVIVPQQALTFNGTFSDAGSAVDAPAAPYQVTWAWGDKSANTTGGPALLPQQQQPHTAPGPYPGTP